MTDSSSQPDAGTDSAPNPYATPVKPDNLPTAVLANDDGDVVLEFALEQSDLVKLSHGHIKTHPQWRKTYLAGWIRTVLIFTVIGFVLLALLPTPYAAMPAFVVAAIFGAAYPLIYKYRVHKGIRNLIKNGRNLGMLGGRRMIFNQRGVYMHSAAGEFLHYWPAVEVIAQHQGNIHVYLSANSAFIVPARAFDSETQRNDFVATLERLKSGSTATVA